MRATEARVARVCIDFYFRHTRDVGNARRNRAERDALQSLSSHCPSLLDDGAAFRARADGGGLGVERPGPHRRRDDRFGRARTLPVSRTTSAAGSACPRSATCIRTPSSAPWRACGAARRQRPTASGPGATRCTASRSPLTPDDVEAIAAQAYVEMLEAGYGAVAEFHYLHHDHSGAPYANRAEMAERIAAAAAETGIGLTLLPVFYARSGFGGAPARAEQRRFVNDLDSYAALVADCRRALGDLVRVGVAPHSLRAATPEEFAARRRARWRRADPHPRRRAGGEVEACLAWSGARPVRWLLDHADVDPRWCLVHATHVDEGEVAALARSGAVAGLCPITEANLGDGVFPAARLPGCGRTVRGRHGFQRRDHGRGRTAACSNTHSGSRDANATSAPSAAARPAPLCSTPRQPAARRRSAARAGRSRRARAADIVSLNARFAARRRPRRR